METSRKKPEEAVQHLHLETMPQKWGFSRPAPLTKTFSLILDKEFHSVHRTLKNCPLERAVLAHTNVPSGLAIQRGCIKVKEPRAGSFLKQRISLSIEIANSASVFGTTNDKNI